MNKSLSDLGCCGVKSPGQTVASYLFTVNLGGKFKHMASTVTLIRAAWSGVWSTQHRMQMLEKRTSSTCINDIIHQGPMMSLRSDVRLTLLLRAKPGQRAGITGKTISCPYSPGSTHPKYPYPLHPTRDVPVGVTRAIPTRGKP